jgi:TolB protein
VDWSPDGDKIAFTSHVNGDGAPGPNQGNDNPTTEIFVMNADGTGDPIRLTDNDEEETAPDWSPDGTRILFACRPEQLGGTGPFEICVMDVDGPENNRTQLTHDSEPDDNDPNTPRILVFHGTSVWSPDGTKIVFHRNPVNQPAQAELWWLVTEDDCLDGAASCPSPLPLTNTPGPGVNLAPNWGVVRMTGQDKDQVVAEGKDKNGTADHGKQHKDKGKKDPKHKQRHGGGKRHR